MPDQAWTRRFPREVGALDSIFEFVREFLQLEGLEGDGAFEADLVLEELFTNLVRHNRGRQEIEIALSRADGDLVLRLRDFDVDPFDPTQFARQRGEAAADLSPGGRGIVLVLRMTKEFRYDYRDRTSTLTARLAWRGEQPA
ncbi:MAG TPA: ATP-binding protein [Acidobacteriota bacterium]|nr:ATP-binding protein [Acidobacteriota bacterium]